MTEHTALPWKVSEKKAKRFTIIRIVTDTLPAPHRIATMPFSTKKCRENARFIVTACNCHADLLEAAKNAAVYLDSLGYSTYGLKQAIRKAEETP